MFQLIHPYLRSHCISNLLPPPLLVLPSSYSSFLPSGAIFLANFAGVERRSDDDNRKWEMRNICSGNFIFYCTITIVLYTCQLFKNIFRKEFSGGDTFRNSQKHTSSSFCRAFLTKGEGSLHARLGTWPPTLPLSLSSLSTFHPPLCIITISPSFPPFILSLITFPPSLSLPGLFSDRPPLSFDLPLSSCFFFLHLLPLFSHHSHSPLSPPVCR